MASLENNQKRVVQKGVTVITIAILPVEYKVDLKECKWRLVVII
jgi:hypothetical protein